MNKALLWRVWRRMAIEFLRHPSWWFLGWVLESERAKIDAIIQEEFDRE